MQAEDLQQIKQIIVENNRSLATKDDLEGLAMSIKNGFDAVDERFNKIEEKFDKKFEDVYSRLDSIDAKLAFIQKELADIKDRLTKLEQRTIEDSNVLGSDVLDLRNRVVILEKKIEQLSHS